MTQFDPSMVAEMLMSPIRRASENLGGGPMGIGADAGGSYFVDPEVAGRTGYGTAVTGASFFPGAGIVDAYGGAVDISGQPLPSFGENIGQGNYLDAALQGLGVAGDVATVAAPATLGASAVLGAMLKAPRAASKYKFENPIKVYQGRSKKGTKDFINPTDFYGDEKVSFATTELATADQFANKQTVNYPGRAKDGSEGPTKTTLIPGDVAELEFDIQNPLEVNRKDIGFKRDNEKAVIAEAKAKGHDGLKIVNDVSDKVDYVAFDSEQVRVVNPSLYPDRDYDYSPTSAELPSDVASIAKVEPPKSIEQNLSQKYPDIDLSVFENKNGLTLSKIVVPENQRSEGIGTKVMDDLIDYADKNNLSIGVTPDATFGGSKTRLESFYKKFGFVRNKGRNKDFTFRETFVRQPKDSD